MPLPFIGRTFEDTYYWPGAAEEEWEEYLASLKAADPDPAEDDRAPERAPQGRVQAGEPDAPPPPSWRGTR
jgi:hypothetical protein